MQIERIDWPAKRIYLHADTVTEGYDPIQLYFEHNLLVQKNENNEQGYLPACSAEGNIRKGGGTFTSPYLFTFTGWRIVPFNGVDHILTLNGETVSEEELSDRDVFDRSSLTVSVDIDPNYDNTEVREVQVGGVIEIPHPLDFSTINTVLSKQTVSAAISNQDMSAEITDNSLVAEVASAIKATHQDNTYNASVCE